MPAPTVILSFVLTLLRTFAARRQMQQSLGQVLARDDDRLLDDIGLNRHDALRLIARPSAYDPALALLRFRTFTLAAATGAGSFR